MEPKECVLLLGVLTVTILGCVAGESGFLVTAPKQFSIGSAERVCATFFDLQETVLTVRVKQRGNILVEISGSVEEDNACYDLKVPVNHQGRTTLNQVADLEAEVSGRSSNGETFASETYKQQILLSDADKLQTYIQTDKPIYKAGQTVKFRILTLEYPDLKPHIQKIRRIYVEEPGGRRIQQWHNVETQIGLADLEMALSPEPPLGEWTIFAAVGQKKVRQSFEVGEYVLPKFGVNIIPQPKYVYRRAEQNSVKICGEYSYGEPVKGSIEANFSMSNDRNHRYNLPFPTVSRIVEDTGSDGCHTFTINLAELNMEQIFQQYRATDQGHYFHVDVAFTEHGTDVTMTENVHVADLSYVLYNLVIDGPNKFKPGLPYHGQIRLSYPDKYPVSNKNVEVTLTNFEGGVEFQETINVPITKGVGKFELTPPREAAYTKLKVQAKVVTHEGTPQAVDITVDKYLQARFSPSGNFLAVAPMPGGKQSGQEDNINVNFTVPSDEPVTFHYKIMSRGNIVHIGQRTWRATALLVNPLPNLEFQPIPRTGGFEQQPQSPIRGRAKRSRSFFWDDYYSRPRPRPTKYEDPELPDYAAADVRSISLPFTVTSHMGPKSRVLVYYIRSDGEVVSGSAEFTVANVFNNQVSLEFASEEARPGAPIQLTVNASPQSLCALGVVDKSVHLLRDSNQLTAQKVQSPLQSFNELPSVVNLNDKCTETFRRPVESELSPEPIPERPPPGPSQPRPQNRKGRPRFRRTSPPRPVAEERVTLFSRHLDAIDAFNSAGMIVLTNYDVATRPCYSKITQIRNDRMYHFMGLPGPRGPVQAVPMARGGDVQNGGFIQDSPMMKMFEEPMEDDIMEDILVETELTNNLPEEDDSSPLVEIRSYFPETWLWLLAFTSDSGSANVESEVPHTITEWVANGFCTSSEDGFGIANPVELRAFQPFFLSYNLPYSAIREEKIPVDVTVFNYLTECFTIELTIEESTEFSLLDASRNKYVCVCDRESKTVNYTIIPRTLGEVKITVHGSYATPGLNVPMCGNNAFLPNVDGVRDAIEDTLLVEPEGVEREETFSEMVCVEKGQDASIVVPLSLPTDLILDSARGRVFVTGDIMGSVLANLDSILRMPTGCGEQNMILFAPNIYVLQYLTSTDQLTKDIEEKALNFLRIGYQRELTYRLSDGSYSAFGESDGEGSTWLTAFVLKSFFQANIFIDIDTSDITVTQNWLLRQQKKDSGCFRNRGVLRHQSMKGGVSDEVTLTAYVMVALLEAGTLPNDPKVVKAEQCITARLTEVYHDPYALALVTYALLLAENPDGRLGLQQMDTLAHTESGGTKYWKRTDSEPVATDCHYCKEPSASVEMTSYALLAYLVCDEKDIADARPIVRWMNTQRSALGGYSSTQDTVMGLQSLAVYASEVYRNDTNMAIDVSKVGTGTFLNRFVVNAENQILSQRLELDEVPTTLSFFATGLGCALVQAELRYNVPAVRTIRREPFEITLDMSPPDNVQHCGKKTLTTCVRYVGPRAETNMAAVEFKMVTGYYVDIKSLGLYLQQHGQAIGLKRVDPPSKGQPLVLYFDQFDNTHRCFDVEVRQKVFVDSAKPASIKVYDYYEPGVKSYKEYNTCPPKQGLKKD